MRSLLPKGCCDRRLCFATEVLSNGVCCIYTALGSQHSSICFRVSSTRDVDIHRAYANISMALHLRCSSDALKSVCVSFFSISFMYLSAVKANIVI